MEAQEIVIDDEVMEELREISEKKGRSLEDTIKKYTCAFGEVNGNISIKTNAQNLEEFDYYGNYVLEEILEDEETMEDIRKESAQTGESPVTIAQRFVDFLNDLRLHADPNIRELRQLVASFSQKEEYKKVV